MHDCAGTALGFTVGAGYTYVLISSSGRRTLVAARSSVACSRSGRGGGGPRIVLGDELLTMTSYWDVDGNVASIDAFSCTYRRLEGVIERDCVA